jgi:outer membrane biosynthesis protein TonB
MKRLKIGGLAFFAAVLLLASCNDAALEEKVADLEKRVADLESKTPAAKSSALTKQINQPESNAPQGDVPEFKFEESAYDFGSITEGDVVEHIFKFTNTGEAPLVIQSASASCGCTVPNYPREPIAPGETGEIEVKFDSSNKPGIQNKTVSITANTDPTITRLTIKSNVVPKSEQAAGPVRK